MNKYSLEFFPGFFYEKDWSSRILVTGRTKKENAKE